MSYLTDLLGSTREELNRVDSKASLMLAAVGVIIGAVVVCFTASDWTPASLNPGEQALWWAGVLAATVGVLLISAAVYPRSRQHRSPHPGVPLYYKDVAAFPDISCFRRAVGQAPDATERLIDQSYSVAKIVQAKYAQLRGGLLSLLVAVVACAFSLILHAIVR